MMANIIKIIVVNVRIFVDAWQFNWYNSTVIIIILKKLLRRIISGIRPERFYQATVNGLTTR